MPDASLGLVTYPFAIASDIFGEALGSGPTELGPGIGMHWGFVGPFWRDLDQGLVDQHCNRVQVAGVGFQAKSLGFEWDRSAAGERIKDRRWLAVAGMPDFFASCHEDGLVGGVLPLDQLADDNEQPLALGLLGLGCGKPVGVGGRVIHDLGE